MAYPETVFSSRNQMTYNGAKHYAIWRHRGPRNSECVGFAHKTRCGLWVATATNPQGIKRDFDAPKLSELRDNVLAFMG